MDISLSERIDFLTKERSEKRVSQEVQVLGVLLI